MSDLLNQGVIAPIEPVNLQACGRSMIWCRERLVIISTTILACLGWGVAGGGGGTPVSGHGHKRTANVSQTY